MANFSGKLVPIILLFTYCYSKEADYDWKCTDQCCQDKICPELPEECMDSTKALLIPSVDECNCCNHCFIFLKEGDDCLKTTSQLQLPTTMCANGLTCNQHGKCVKMADGVKDVDFYPNYECDANGRCYCAVINETGHVERIFGQFKESKMNKNETQCECSVVAYKAMRLDLRVLPFEDIHQPSARCLPNGQFDPLQCIGEFCGCVDKDTGIPDGNGFIYNVFALERNYPYCFDPLRHKPGNYYTPCELRRNRLMQDINEKYWENFNFIHLKEIDCNPDGTPVSKPTYSSYN